MFLDVNQQWDLENCTLGATWNLNQGAQLPSAGPDEIKTSNINILQS